MIVVVESFRAHAGIFRDRVIGRQPFLDGGDARVARFDLGIDESEEPGVTHAGVGTHGGFAIAEVFGAGLAIPRPVDETAFVFGIVADP